MKYQNMQNNKEIISELKGLVNIVNDGKEGYAMVKSTYRPGNRK